MKKRKYIIIFIYTFIYIFIFIGQDRAPIEELDIINGLGYDIKENSKTNIDYLISYSAYIYQPTIRRSNTIYEGEALNIGEVHQDKQKRSNKKVIQGQERAIIISREYAQYGVKGLIDERFRNPEFNDRAYVVVSNGMAKDYLKYNQPQYNSSSEFIFGLIDNAYNYNFFSNDYKIVDVYVRIGAEGRSLVLPYITMKEKELKLDGITLFKKDKLIAEIDMENTKILNLLRNDNVRGALALQDDDSKYIDFYAESKDKKVKCYKNNDKYSFVIDLNLNGNVISNELYKDITKDIIVKKKFEKDMAQKVEDMCYGFIKTMQQEYKVDCLELGRVAVAEFGRRKNIDWDEAITKADIKVNVKVNVSNYGRGDY